MYPGCTDSVLRQTLSEIGTCLARVLLITDGTRDSIGAHLRGRGRGNVDQLPMESVSLAKDKSAVDRVNPLIVGQVR